MFSLNRMGFRFMQFRDSLRLEVICDDEGLFPVICVNALPGLSMVAGRDMPPLRISAFRFPLW